MKDVLELLRTLRRQRPFVAFVIVLKDGRRFLVSRALQFGFNESHVGILDDRDRIDFFSPSEIADLEQLKPVA
jgi:hypothetical protein